MNQRKDKEVFHRIRCCGREFNWKQWGDYCAATREDPSQQILTTFGKYTFNDHDICLNPDVVELNVKNGSYAYYVNIKYAECGNGIWVFGLDCCTATCAGGYGCAWSDVLHDAAWHGGYPSQRDCLIAACDAAVTRLQGAYNLGGDNRGVMVRKTIEKVQEYQKSLTRPKVVQLELF